MSSTFAFKSAGRRSGAGILSTGRVAATVLFTSCASTCTRLDEARMGPACAMGGKWP